MIRVQLERLTLRPWCDADVATLPAHANNPAIAKNLTDAFPSPYTHDDAVAWIHVANSTPRMLALALELDGEAIGGITLTTGADVFRLTAEIGYWLSERFHGRGLVAEAVRGLVAFSFSTTELVRIWARPYAFNQASQRVLVKSGFTQEGVQRRAAVKRGEIVDLVVFALLKDEFEQQESNKKYQQGTTESAS